MENPIQSRGELDELLSAVLEPKLKPPPGSPFKSIKTRASFIKGVWEGIDQTPMTISLTPHTLSVADWPNSFEDHIRWRFLPMKSNIVPDHPKLTLNSLRETANSPGKEIVYRNLD